MVVPLGLWACSAPAPRLAAGAAVASPAAEPNEGTVTLIRPVATTDRPAAGDARRAILLALGGSADAGAEGGAAGPAEEIIVQMDSGATRSVVQQESPGLAPGARVRLIRAAVARVQPLAATGPGR